MEHELVLDGCNPAVLASYLKALAVIRLVSAQLDPGARAWWDADGRFHLASEASWEGLVEFFVHRYRPTPIVTPWNGGSGFHPGDQLAGIEAIASSADPRFAPYRAAIGATRQLLTAMGVTEKPDGDRKQALLERARSTLPDDVLPWLDAAYVVGDVPGFAAILGTGGNDGRLEFANNFMQRLAEMFLAPQKGRRREATLADRVDAALFAKARAGVHAPVSFGQFAPARAGGANMGEGIEGPSRVNPWDYVFTIEGAMLFAGAAVRRLESGGDRAAAFPFHVAMSAVGYGSAGRADDDRGNARSELWLPLWSQPATFAELVSLFGEGRLQVGRRRAHDGLDAVQAVASLGVDRGVDRFQRIGILKRNGLAFLATSQGTIDARRVPDVELLEDLHEHVSVLSRGDVSPAVGIALHGLRRAMFDACQGAGRGADVLAALGRLERALARSPKSRPYRLLRGLSSHWYRFGDDDSAEFAAAASFASWKWLRPELEPTDGFKWLDTAKPSWTGGDPLRAIADVARRRIARGERASEVDDWSFVTRWEKLRALLNGCFDRARFEDLLFALAMVKQPPREKVPLQGDPHVDRDDVFWTLRAVTTPHPLIAPDVPRSRGLTRNVVAVLEAVTADRIDDALAIADRRLRALGRPLRAPVRCAVARDRHALAAALVLPLPPGLERRFFDDLLRPPNAPETHERNTP
ncbi:MAG: type I-U CRISPR-associated protein Csx17 [Polyangiales bacterium]